MSGFRQLKELNLSGNMLEEQAELEALATIPYLTSLDLSDNKFRQWLAVSILRLKELRFGRNLVNKESQMLPCVQLNPQLVLLEVTGNPFCKTMDCYALDSLLKKRNGVLICTLE